MTRRLEPTRALRIYDLLLACGWVAGAPAAQQHPCASATTTPVPPPVPPAHAGSGAAVTPAPPPLWAGPYGAYSGELEGASAGTKGLKSSPATQGEVPAAVPFPGFMQ